MKKKTQKIVLWDEEVRNTVHNVIDAAELDGKIEIIIRPFYESVSDKQRGYYRSTVLPALADYTGYTPDEMHEFCIKKFGTTSQIEVHGECFDVSLFTTSNQGEVAAMNAYLNNIVNWASAGLGLYIPPPKKDWKKERKAA